jgi:hypothetical protein
VTMKNYIALMLVIMMLAMTVAGWAEDKPVMADRQLSIAFEAMLMDDADLPFDGQVNVEASFYNAPVSDPGNLVYAESFADVEVGRGRLRVPLLTGTPEQGTIFSKEAFAAIGELYVDMMVNGSKMVSLYPLRSSFSAVRAEYAQTAEGMRVDLDLEPGDIPQHQASLITSGELDAERIPHFPGSRIDDGAFAVEQLPDIPGSSLDGMFPAAMLPSNFNADDITAGSLIDDVVTNAIIRKSNVNLAHGVASDGDHLTMPGGAPRENCKILLSMNYAKTDSAGQGIDWWQIYDEDGTVRCKFSHREDQGDQRSCSTNYLIICVQ